MRRPLTAIFPFLPGINYIVAGTAVFIMLVYAAMTHAPLVVFLVELFPARIRYVSRSFPYQIGYVWAGGNVPLVATAIVVMTGDVYAGLRYPAIVALITVAAGLLFLRDNRHKPSTGRDRRRTQAGRMPIRSA